jgi:hypothetical protein
MKVVGVLRMPADVFSDDPKRVEAAWAEAETVRVSVRFETAGVIGDAYVPLTPDNPMWDEGMEYSETLRKGEG